MTNTVASQKPEEVQKKVRDHYAQALDEATTKASVECCCGGSDSSTNCCSDAQLLYEEELITGLPSEVTDISFGCGDPVTLASLKAGQTVLDLGSGGGIDCFIAARKVGPDGHVIGVDMTPQMIDRARANKEKMAAANVDFRLGEIEHLPVADNSVDVVISNCVINLSIDKPQVFREVFRVLKPGGKLAVSDIVTDGELPAAIKGDLAAWAGCVAGAIDVSEYTQAIEVAGLTGVKVTPVFLPDEMIEDALGLLDQEILRNLDREKLRRTVFSAKITAEKS